MNQNVHRSFKTSLAVRVAKELAFHADLLVLHAAIEAPRPGAQSVEFAAVAGKVRNLASYGARAMGNSADSSPSIADSGI